VLRTFTLALLLVSFSLFTGTANALMELHPLESPNGDFKVVIAIGPFDQTSAAVFYKGEQIVTLGQLGFLLESGATIPSYSLTREHWEKFLEIEPTRPLPKLSEGMRLSHPFSHEFRNEGEAPYNESSVEYIGLLKIVFRAYDHGIAFRYEFGPREGKTLTIQKELTEFRFSDDYLCKTAGQESERVRLSGLIAAVESPLTVELSDSVSLIVGGTPPGNFAPMKLRFGTKWESTFNNLFDSEGKINRTGKPTSVVAALDRTVTILGADHSSWRFAILDGKEAEAIFESLKQSNISFPLDFTPAPLPRPVGATRIGDGDSPGFRRGL